MEHSLHSSIKFWKKKPAIVDEEVEEVKEIANWVNLVIASNSITMGRQSS